MADRIAELYKKSLDAGVLTEGLTEDMFREQTKTDEGLRSFYDVLQENGMKLTPWDTFRGKARGEIMDNQPAQPAQPAQQPESGARVPGAPLPDEQQELERQEIYQGVATPMTDKDKDQMMLQNAEQMKRNAAQMAQRAGQMSMPEQPSLSLAPKDGSIAAATERMQRERLPEIRKQTIAKNMLDETYSERNAVLDEMFPIEEYEKKGAKRAEYGVLAQNDPYLKAADNILMGAQTRMSDAKRQNGVSWSNVGNGIVSFAKDATRHLLGDMEGTLSFGMSDLRDAMIQRQVLKKIAEAEAYDNPEQVLTPQEKVLYDAIATNIAVEIARQNDTSRWSKAGQITADMIPFIADIMTGNALFKGMGNAARKAITQSVEKAVKNKLAKWLLTNVSDVAISAGESALTATILPRTYGKMYETAAQVDMNKVGMDGDYRLKIGGVDQQSLGKSWAQAEGDQIKEIFTETGGNFRLIGRALIDNPVGKKILKTPFGMVLKRFEGAQGGAGSRFASMTMYHGVLGEWLEELEGAIYDGNLKDFFTADTQLPMLLSFSVPAAFTGGLNAGQQALYQAKYDQAGKRIDKLIDASSYVGPDKNTIKGQILATLYQTPTENLPQAIGMCVEQVYPEEYKALMEGAPEKGNKAAELSYALKEYLTSGTVLTIFDPDMIGGQIADVQAHRQQMRQQAEQNAQAEVQSISHEDGNIYRVGIKGKDGAEGYAFRGDLDVVPNQEGTLITRGRDLITIKMTDGTVEQVPADEVTLLDAPASAADRVQAVADHLFAQYANNDLFQVGDKVHIMQNGQPSEDSSTIVNINDEGVEVEIIDPNGQPNTTIIPHEQAAEMLSKDETGTEDGIVTYTMQDGNTVRLRDMGNGVYNTIVPDGEQPEIFTEEELAEAGAVRANQPTVEQNSATSEQNSATLEQPTYPTDEEGNPAWNQIEVPQAAQLLYDTFKQNNAAAQSYADDQLKEAEKVQKKAATQKSHSLNIAQRIAEDEQNAAFKAQADAAVKYWQDVKLSIGQIKTAEEQAAKEAQQLAMQQAREQRSKTEEGTVTAPTMAERYAAADKIEGNTGTMTLPDGRELSGRYMLIAPQGVTPSHDVTKNFQRSEGYPVTSNGQSINDRDYTSDKEEQQKVQSIAQNFNGNAIKNMPVISDEGLVYNGNGRMMAGQLAALNGTDAAYTQSLMNNAAQYGFTPEQVASIPNARVVFQLDERLPYSTQSLAIFNEQETQTQSNTGKAAGYARKLTPQAVSEVLAAVDGFNTIDAFFSDKKAPFNLINSLINAGIIAQREKAEMVDGDKLSATGRERLSNILFGTVFDNETIRLMGDDAALKNSILRALPQILDNKSLGEFSLEADINDAIRLLYQVRNAGMPFRSFVSQTVIAEDGQVHTAAEEFSPYQLLLAEEMSEGGVDAFRDVLTAYNNEARTVQGGQVDIFNNLQSPAELKNLILQRYGKEPNEQERPSAGREADNPAESTPASNEPAEVGEEQITLTDGRVVTPATITREDFALLGDMTPIQRALIAIRANLAQHPEWGLSTAGFGNDARGLLFHDLPDKKSDLKKVEEIYWRTQQEYVAEPNKTEEYRLAADDVLREIYRRLQYIDSDKYPIFQGSALISRLKDAELAVAEAETDTNPTEAQKKAENYKQGHVTLWGLPITIENPKGSIRRGTDANGKQWEQEMHHTYGKIRRTEGVDGDHIDVFIGPNLTSDKVFVVDQRNVNNGEFDEHKVMLGFDSLEDAQNGYLSNYEEGWQGMGTVTEVTMDEFKKWIDSSHRKTKPFADYKSVKPEGAAATAMEAPTDNRETTETPAEEPVFDAAGLRNQAAEAKQRIDATLNKLITSNMVEIPSPDVVEYMSESEARQLVRKYYNGGYAGGFGQEIEQLQNDLHWHYLWLAMADEEEGKPTDWYDNISYLYPQSFAQNVTGSPYKGILIELSAKAAATATAEPAQEQEIPEASNETLRKRLAKLVNGWQLGNREPSDGEMQELRDECEKIVKRYKAPTIKAALDAIEESVAKQKAEGAAWIFTDDEETALYQVVKAILSKNSNKVAKKVEKPTKNAENVQQNLQESEKSSTFAGVNNNNNGNEQQSNGGVSSRSEGESGEDRLQQSGLGRGDRASQEDLQTLKELLDGKDPDEQQKIARQWAEEHGVLFDLFQLINEKGLTDFPGGNENSNWIDKQAGVIYKMNNLMNSKNRISVLLERVALYNQLFPETRLDFVGLATVAGGRQVYPVYSQVFVAESRNASVDEIKESMHALGFEPTGKTDGEFSNEQYIIGDARPRNVLVRPDNKVVYVDVDVTLAPQNEPTPTKPKRKQEQTTSQLGTNNSEVVSKQQPSQQKADPKNTIFTDEAYEAAKARMKARLNRLNMGVDPEAMIDEITIAGYHIERGVRKFADFARELIKEFGDGIRERLKPMYNYFRDIPEGRPYRDEMDHYDTVMAFDLDTITAEEEQPASVEEEPEEEPEHKFKVGDRVIYGDIEYEVTGITKDGKYDIENPNNRTGFAIVHNAVDEDKLFSPSDTEGLRQYYKEQFYAQIEQLRKRYPQYSPEEFDKQLVKARTDREREIDKIAEQFKSGEQQVSTGVAANFAKLWGERDAIEDYLEGRKPTAKKAAPKVEDKKPKDSEEAETVNRIKEQYDKIKEQYPDATLLFRVGDFYELYKTDAEEASKILAITLTHSNIMGENTPMAGFPFHALDKYLPMLVRAGKRVAICDQLEDPKKAKGLVKRGVTELVTPSVPYQEEAKEEKKDDRLFGTQTTATHTKTGAEIIVVKPYQRVENFAEINALARKHHGRYNTKPYHAFVFDTEEDAEAFNLEAGKLLPATDTTVEETPKAAKPEPKKEQPSQEPYMNHVYNMDDWHAAGDLRPAEGQEVVAEIIETLRGDGMPTTDNSKYFQAQEPYSHDRNGKPLYKTFEKIDGKWFYRGIMPDVHDQVNQPKQEEIKPEETALEHVQKTDMNKAVQMQLDLFADMEPEFAPQATEETQPTEAEQERTEFTEDDVHAGLRVRLRNGEVKDIVAVSRSTEIIPGVGNTKAQLGYIYFTDGTECKFDDIEAIHVKDALTPKKKVEEKVAAASGDPNDPKRVFARRVSSRLLDALASGDTQAPFRSILDLRKLAKEVGLQVDENGKDDIMLKELVEDGIVQAARQVIESRQYGGAKSKTAYDAIVRLYEMQPSIQSRSSNSIAMAQFSTPIPMGFVADMFAYSPDMKTVLEPTAGNGMLVFAIPAERIHANELDEKRLENLRLQGFKVVTSQDAREPLNRAVSEYDAVIANPPFGPSPAKMYDGKEISGLDPQIAINALSAMKDDGRAAIIIGGNMEYADNGSVKDHKAFWTYLYDHYNVKGVVDMDGELYRRQGTTYDVRMILIDGRRSEAERAQTKVIPPVQSKAVAKVKTFDELYNTVLDLLHSNNKTNGNEVLRTQSAPLSDNRQSSGQPVKEGHRGESNADVANGQRSGRENGSQGTQQPSKRGVSQTPATGASNTARPTDAGVSQPKADTGVNAPAAASDRSSVGDNGRVQSEPVQSVRTPADGVGLTPKAQEKRNLTAEKLSYRPHSQAFSLQSVAPAAMVEAMDKVLAEIERTTGKSIDQFVADELGYDSVQDAHNALAAEQMDSVAMAIYQMYNGMSLIIGDQTGVGKGRQMAALIRWAVQRGKKPIFITQKADLFSDIYRDLVDIGSGDLRPFIFNSDGAMVNSQGETVHRPLSSAEQRKVFESGVLPDEYDFAVLTYSQVNTGDEISRQTKNKDGYKIASKKTQGRPSPKADFLRQIANDNYLFLDESHTAAGDSNIGAYIRSIIGTKASNVAEHNGAKAVTFASATFAKRPDTMPMYALRTAMSAANVEQEKLIEIIEKGGVTLQEIMSRALTESGQMVRRERDMSDVQTDWKTIDDPEIVRKAREQYDRTITAFNAIIDFQTRYITPLINEKDLELAAMMETVSHKKGTKSMGIDNTPFASKTYNYTKQLMLALKVDAIVAEVEKEIQAGRHPVIALESTMEASIKDYAPGERIDEPTFSASLLRGLDSCMQYTITDEEGKEVHGMYSPAELGPEGEAAYYRLQEFIRESTKDIFISPLDAIIEGLKAKGYRVGELTGRNTYVERDDDGKVVVRRRTDKDKKKMQRDFNRGALDVLILNKSASTGISLHSSKTFADPRQRSMIIAQPLSDINDYMQMIGRIDRTGQVHRGYYINLGLPVPAESRFLMMLSTKLKSLNANTTTSQDSESNEVDAPDLLNKYGSQVVIEYLRDNPTIYEKIGEPLKGGNGTIHAEDLEEYKPSEDDALKITGRVALLSTKEQEEFYQEVVRRYNDLIRYLNDTGMNDLKITTMPLRAKTLARKVSSEGKDPNGTNPFAGNAYVEKVEMDVLRKPMKADEVRKLMEQLNGNDSKARIDAIWTTINTETKEKADAENERYAKAMERVEKEVESFAAKVNANEKLSADDKQRLIDGKRAELAKAQEDKHNANNAKIQSMLSYMRKALFDMFSVGHTYLVPDDLEALTFATSAPAIFCGFKAKDSKITPSTTFAVFATLDGRRKVEVKLTELAVLSRIQDHTMMNYDAARQTTLDNWDTQIPTQTRKEGYIMTGNILQAVSDSQDQMGNYPGQLVSYTDIDGNVHDGILMPDKWEPGQLRNAGAPIAARFEQMKHGTVTSADGKVTIRRGWGAPDFYYLDVPKSRKEGGQYYLNKDILPLVEGGEFYTSHGQMEARVPAENMPRVLDILSNLGVKAEPEANERAEFSIGPNEYDASNLTEAQRLATRALIETLNDNTDLDVFMATDEEAQDVLPKTPDASQVEHPMRSTYNTQGVTGETPELSIKVNHNSPYLLKKADGTFVDPVTGEKLGFDHRFMSKGEGGQAHGYGSYFSVNDLRNYAENNQTISDEIKDAFDATVFNDGSVKQSVIDEWLYSKARRYYERALSEHPSSFRKWLEDNLEHAKSIVDRLGGANFEEEVATLSRQELSILSDRREDVRDISTLLEAMKKDMDLRTRHHYDVEIPDNDGTNYLEEMKTLPIAQRRRIADAVRALDGEPESSVSYRNYTGGWQQLGDMIERNQWAYLEIRDRLVQAFGGRLADEKRLSELMHDIGFVGVHYDGRRDGECYVIFNENDAKITDHRQFMRTSDGTLYGWAIGDRIYLTKAGLNPNTPIHEYTHLWAKAMRRNNQEGWQSIVNIFKDTPFWQEVVDDENYASIRNNDDAICSEVLARYSGTRGAARMEEAAAEMLHEADQTDDLATFARTRRLISRVRQALSDFWHWVGVNLFGIKHFDSAEQVADRVLFDMLNGTELKPEDQTTTNNFKAWFGDWQNDPEHASKVVDKKGRPLVVYHGSPYTFTEFRAGRPIYAFNKLNLADQYRHRRGNLGVSMRPAPESSIVEGYMNLRNPFIFEVHGAHYRIAKQYVDYQLHGTPYSYGDKPEWISADDVVKMVQEDGRYDGVIFKDMYDNLFSTDKVRGDIYVAFDPNQIKSVNNSGEFSTEDDDIERSVSRWTPEQMRAIQEWNEAHPHPQYQVGEKLDHYAQRLHQWEEARKQFRASMNSAKPSAEEAEKADRPVAAGTPAFVPGVKPTPTADESPAEYALRLKQYYQLMRDEAMVADYVAEINAQADAAAKGLKKNTLVRGLLDAAKPIENFQEWMAQRGATMTDGSNAYTDTFLASGRVSQAHEQLTRDILRPLTKQVAKIIAPDEKTGKSRLDDINLTWQNMDVDGSGIKIDGKKITPIELVGLYCQAKDIAEAKELGLPDRGAAGFKKGTGMSHEDYITAFESRIPLEERDELWRLINAATHFALKYDYEAGRISEDTLNEYYKREFYVPQRGWRERSMSGIITAYEPVGKRADDPYNAALVTAHGRNSLAEDPFAYIMSIDASSIISSENNKIKQKFLRFCLDNEDLGLKTGAFRIKKYWIMNVIDPETGRIKLDADGNPMMEVSYSAPSTEDLQHDKETKQQIQEKRKQLSKVRSAFEKQNEHGDMPESLQAAYETKIARLEQAIEDLENQMHIAWHATNTNISQRTSDEKKQHEVQVLLDGEKYVIELQDEKLANAINKKFKQHQESLFDTTQKMRNATRFMSAMLTQYNPEFAASNFARDYQVALATLMAEHRELVGPFMKYFATCQGAVWKYAFNDKVRDQEAFADSEMGKYLREYFASGAHTGFSYMQDLKSLRRDFDAMVNESNVRRGIKGAVGVFSMLTEVSETAVRFAGFVAARKNGMGLNEAAYLSKELTTNFDRAGEVADTGWMAWFSFFRATLNGNLKFLKALKKMPLAYSLVAVSYFAMGMLNQFLNPDDPDDEIWASDYTRQSNFVLGKIRVPVAHFMRMFFGAGVNAAQWIQGNKTFGHAVYNTATFASNEMLPNYLNVLGNGTEWNSREGNVDFTFTGLIQGAMPSPVSPITDVWFNRDFRGATINREPFTKAQEGKKDILMGKEHTLPIYKWLTQSVYEAVGGSMNTEYKSADPAWRSWLFDISPSSLEHVVEGYIPAGADMFVTLGEAIYDAATGEPTGPEKWPFIRKFYNAYTPERAYMQQYYLLNGRVNEFERTLKDYQKNDPAQYRLLRNSQQYRTYQQTQRLVKSQSENPTTADVQALIEANKLWLK